MRLTYFWAAVGVASALAGGVRAEESKVKETAKEVGHTVGTAAREVGQGTKKVTKKVGEKATEVARETGHAFRDGAKELKKAVTSEGDDKGSAAKK
jgi:effector-binding domain-containing protein